MRELTDMGDEYDDESESEGGTGNELPTAGSAAARSCRLMISSVVSAMNRSGFQSVHGWVKGGLAAILKRSQRTTTNYPGQLFGNPLRGSVLPNSYRHATGHSAPHCPARDPDTGVSTGGDLKAPGNIGGG